MATYQISPPNCFDFSTPSEWPKWSRRFERFRTASGLVTKSDEEQVNTLIYTMGETAEDILIPLVYRRMIKRSMKQCIIDLKITLLPEETSCMKELNLTKESKSKVKR